MTREKWSCISKFTSTAAEAEAVTNNHKDLVWYYTTNLKYFIDITSNWFC